MPFSVPPLSPTRFGEWTGLQPPKQYILLSRIALARELLTTTDYDVADVAGRCGFGDVSNFIRYFKKGDRIHSRPVSALHRLTAPFPPFLTHRKEGI